MENARLNDSPVSPSSVCSDSAGTVALAARRRVIARDFVLGIAVTLALIFIHTRLEKTWFLEPVRNYWLALCQGIHPRSDVPVVVYDIHDLRPIALEQNATHLTTPRELLKQLIHEIASLNPSAIGVDVDMSSVDGAYDAADATFFAWLLNERRVMNTPIFVGVHRTAGLDPDAWLYESRFRALGAATSVPSDPTYLMATLDEPGAASAHLRPSMALALAAAYHRSGDKEPDIPGYLAALERGTGFGRQLFVRGLHDDADAVDEAPLNGTGYLTDYSVLERIVDNRVPVNVTATRIGSKLVQTLSIDTNHSLAGKIVLIGDAHANDDPVRIPWQRRLVAGVFLHASGAYTLAVAPLYELTGTARFIVDVAATVIAMLSVALIRLRYAARKDVRVAHERLAYALMILAATILLLTCVEADRLGSIVWNDFLLVAIFMIAHPAAQRWFERCAVGARRVVSVVWRTWFLEPEASEVSR